jgi:DNA-binding NarL/FixJ family response regulator
MTLGAVIHLAIIDGSRVFADVLATSLAAEPDIQVVRCATGRIALRQALDHSSADVVLGDAALFDPDSPPAAVGAIPLPRAPLDAVSGRPRPHPARPAVVLLAATGDVSRLAVCLRWGVRGWVPRTCSIDDLLKAIRETDSGGTWIPPKELTRVLGELVWSSGTDDPVQLMLGQLTHREREVLLCLVDGLDRPEVATRLKVSTNTVRTHVQSILAKLGVSSCVAAVALVHKATPPAARTDVLT